MRHLKIKYFPLFKYKHDLAYLKLRSSLVVDVKHEHTHTHTHTLKMLGRFNPTLGQIWTNPAIGLHFLLHF